MEKSAGVFLRLLIVLYLVFPALLTCFRSSSIAELFCDEFKVSEGLHITIRIVCGYRPRAVMCHAVCFTVSLWTCRNTSHSVFQFCLVIVISPTPLSSFRNRRDIICASLCCLVMVSHPGSRTARQKCYIYIYIDYIMG
jgi:hypothetical protein